MLFLFFYKFVYGLDKRKEGIIIQCRMDEKMGRKKIKTKGKKEFEARIEHASSSLGFAIPNPRTPGGWNLKDTLAIYDRCWFLQAALFACSFSFLILKTIGKPFEL
jgi:hypothetical protein